MRTQNTSDSRKLADEKRKARATDRPGGSKASKRTHNGHENTQQTDLRCRAIRSQSENVHTQRTNVHRQTAVIENKHFSRTNYADA